MMKYFEHIQSWYGCYGILLLIMIIIILLSMKTTKLNGRYQIAGNSSNTCWIIDTETSQLWLRNPRGGYELGTNSHPHSGESLLK